MTHIDPADPAVDPVHLVATYLDDIAVEAVAAAAVPPASRLRTVAGELLDELLADERTPPPLVERDADAVRLVDEVLADTVGLHHVGRAEAAEAVVRALLGVPTVTLHDDGRIEVDWHDTPTHRPRACLVARDFVDDLVERLQPEPELTDGDLLDHLADAIDAAHDARPVADAAPELTAKTHTIVDEEGVMIDVTTGVSAPYVALIATHYGKTSGPVAGLDAAAARRLTQRLTDAIADAPEFDPADPSTYPCATRRDCGCEGIGSTACPGRDA